MECYDPLHILDVLPRVCCQVQHPEVFVVIELLSIWRGKLSSEHPELTPTLGNYHGLKEAEDMEGYGSERRQEERCIHCSP